MIRLVEVTALFPEFRTMCSVSLSETVLSVSPTFTTGSHPSHFMPYTTFNYISHPLWLLMLINDIWIVINFMMLSVKTRGQIWHFGEQNGSVISSFALNNLLFLPCSKIPPRIMSLLNATIGYTLRKVFIRSDLWSRFRCFLVISWILWY